MPLDFTELDKIAAETAADGREGQGVQNSTQAVENATAAVATGADGAKQLQLEADRRKQTLKTAGDVYKRYQDAIRDTFLLQAAILKGIRQPGENDIYSLFLMAAKGLALAIDNREFYQQITHELPQYFPDALDALQHAPPP